MQRSLLFLGIMGLANLCLPFHALAGGDEVIVVYNTRVPDSKRLAEYYAERRQVPKKQIFGFELTTGEEISRKEFHEALQMPLFKKLEQAKLWRLESATNGANHESSHVVRKVVSSKIRYAVLCYGVPLKIQPDPNLKEPAEEAMRQELRRNEAAVDSELALLPCVEQDLTLAGPLRNPAYMATNAAALNPTNGVLMVTRLDGPSAAIARGLVDKALEAETDGLWGRAYFDLRGISEPSMKPGDDWIRGAAEACRFAGFETVVDTNSWTFPDSFPMSHIAFYAGWYTENASGPFALPTVEFMPGAFAYHLHSFSASSLRTTNAYWVGPLLAKGATITMGCVYEPYLGGTPDVATFIARLIFQRFTFGEAACAGQSVLSWQTTVVGDPLYRPFGTPPQLLNQELERRHSKLVEWSYLQVVNLSLLRGIPMNRMVDFLEGLPATKQSAVLSEKLGDLCAQEGKPSSSTGAYQQALKLDPSPQQRIRLRLALGEKLRELDRDEDAYQDYQKLVEESPNYPDKAAIYQKLATLAQKLGKKDDAAKYEKQSK